MIERFLALVLIVLLSPMLLILSLVITIFDGWPFWYLQERVGYKGRKFWMWKFRTMVKGAESQKTKLKNKNEADGPVFKIRNDPRLTKLGKFLSHCGLDELPQLFNIVAGQMEVVGPRPLPLSEAARIPEKYKKRLDVKPGIISPWIFEGYHSLGFDKWMQSDMEYIRKKSRRYDCMLFVKGIDTLVKMIITEIIDILTPPSNSG